MGTFYGTCVATDRSVDVRRVTARGGRDARDRRTLPLARAVIATIVLLVVSAALTVLGIRRLARAGRMRPVVLSLVPGLALGELGTAMLGSDGLPHGRLLSSAVLAGGVVPCSCLLRRAHVAGPE